MEGIKKGIGYIYLSIVVHLYALLFLSFIFDKDILEMLLNSMKAQSNEITIENIVVETRTQSKEKPLKGKISDKYNVDRGKPGGKNIYNYPNFNLSEPEKTGADVQRDKKDKGKEENDKTGSIPANDKTSIIKGKPVPSGDYHTSFFDPEKPVDVQMDSEGDISLATIPHEFAAYFLNMQKKVGEKWREFFPVFQYYQGIIKSGEVVVRFLVDESGNVIQPTIIKSYGYSILDQSCVNAIEYAKNFGPLPEKLRQKKQIIVEFRFIYVSR